MRVLFIGDARRDEFQAPLAWLRERTELLLAVNVTQAEAALPSTHIAPALVIFASARPGEFSRAEVERLHARFPLARLRSLLGSWCEGESRSGKPWPGVPRVYANQFIPGFSRWLSTFEEGSPASVDLPRTATDAEVLLATPAVTCRNQHGGALVIARRCLTFEALADACEICGLTAVWNGSPSVGEVRGAALVLWDSAGWGPFERETLERVVAATAPAPVVALLDFPRLHECEQALASGAKAVVSKPYLLNDLLWQIEYLSSSAPRSTLTGPHRRRTTKVT